MNTRTIKSAFAIGIVAAMALLQGCTVKFNDRHTNSHFVFPNSNIQMIGPVRAQVNRTSVILPPNLSSRDVHELVDQAKRQVAGADMVMNYKTETVFRAIPMFVLPFNIYTVKITLDGTAAKMTVGNQELIENSDY